MAEVRRRGERGRKPYERQKVEGMYTVGGPVRMAWWYKAVEGVVPVSGAALCPFMQTMFARDAKMRQVAAAQQRMLVEVSAAKKVVALVTVAP